MSNERTSRSRAKAKELGASKTQAAVTTLDTAKLDFAALRAAALEPWLPYLHGNRFGSVVACKGEPGQAEKQGRPPFFGEDGSALESALEALGWGSNSWCGIALELPGKELLGAEDLRLLIEILDPLALIALDARAASLLQESLGSEILPSMPEPGTRSRVLGRTFVCVDGFEAALATTDEGEAKRRAWQQLQAIKRW